MAVECLQEDAVPTFNLLNTEARYVAAALYPPHKMRITPYQKLKANALISNNFDVSYLECFIDE